MEIGINLNCYSNELSIERQAELMKENGFTKTFDMSDSPLVNDETVGILKEAGITFATLHAPFSKINSMWQVGKDGDKMLLSIADGVDKCAKYNIPVLVVHLSSKFPPPRISDIGNERYQKLMDYAACKGVTIAYENQRTLSNLSYVGSVLIFCVGLNLVWGKKVKVANMLPAVVIAVIWAFFA